MLILTKPLGTGIATTAIKRGMASRALQKNVMTLMSQINTKLDYIAVTSGQQFGAVVRGEMLPQLASAHQAATK